MAEEISGIVSEKLVITEPPKIEDSPNRKLIRKWLNRNMKVKITDGRTVIGIFLCTDKHSNLILGSCHEYFDMPGKFINLKLSFFFKSKNANYYFKIKIKKMKKSQGRSA